MTQNQIKYWTLLEEKRHNVATEDEARRHNLVDEGETYRSNTAREYETMRHNKETERVNALGQAETRRHNLAYESESVRHNKAQEALGYANLDLGYAQLAETSRHNVQSESLGWAQLSETNRHNVLQEQISQKDVEVRERQNVLRAQELNETIRHNRAGEANVHEGNITKLAGSSNLIASSAGLGALGAEWLSDSDSPVGKGVQLAIQNGESIFRIVGEGLKMASPGTYQLYEQAVDTLFN